jgi:TetR/AcrR family transcriptional regulator, mexJK operon transcriptional repressor
MSEVIESKRHAIVQAATQLFLTHNYRNVSMDKIAAAAPVSKATLYNHFTSKNELFAAVVSKLCTSLLQTITLSEDDNAEQTLQKIAASFVELLYSADGLAMYRLVVSESHEFPELGQLLYDNSARLALTQLENYLQQLQNTGCFYIPNTRFAADAFFSLLKGDLHFRCLLGIQAAPTEQEKNHLIESATTFYLRGILHAAQS